MLLCAVVVLAGNFPWLLPVLQYIVQRSARQKIFTYLYDTATMLIHERRKDKESRKVSVHSFPSFISFPLIESYL